jgi:hypothetical protein
MRELVMELAEERRSKSESNVQTAAFISKRISQNKPPVFTGAGESAALEICYRSLIRFLMWCNILSI